MAPELIVRDLPASLEFWTNILGFARAYERPEDGFVYLQRRGVHVMLCEQSGEYETGPLDAPFGRGVMFQMQVDDIGPAVAALERAGWPLYQPVREAWYRAGVVERGLRQFLVQDPDGYLLMIYEELGVRAKA